MSLCTLLLIMFVCESLLLLAIYVSTVYMPIDGPLYKLDEEDI